MTRQEKLMYIEEATTGIKRILIEATDYPDRAEQYVQNAANIATIAAFLKSTL